MLFYDPDGHNDIVEKRQYVFTEWDPTAASDIDALRSVFDSNGDGDYFDAGETITYLSQSVNGTIPERARAVEYALVPEENSFFFSTDRHSSVGDAEDIVRFNGKDRFDILFDGSELGINRASIDAFDIISDSEILMSFNRGVRLEGLGRIDDSDVVKFTATSLGEGATAGQFEMFLKGRDIGLTRGQEDIDALTGLADGSLLFSTSGRARLSNGLQFADEDIIRYDPASGEASLYVDGSDVALNRRNGAALRLKMKMSLALHRHR